MRQPNKAIAEARAAGLTFFDTGEPCRMGHRSPRYVSNWICVACAKLRHREESLSGKKKEWNQKAAERRGTALGDYGGVPHHAPLSAPEIVTWGGPYPALMSGKWRKP